MGNYIIYKVNGGRFVPYQQVMLLDKEVQELKIANQNLRSMLDMVLKAKGGGSVRTDTGRESNI